ncbi:DmsC/YnfH family molybdoenzyme membrane anchor subunit [Rahnella aceris]|uniref:DmsC/YnfH family molybdoenzyme membrane anchor subunit n=1 Tax=Rahnella sp. (strain Y9602) TaxID=2703885 RepID=UPI001F10841F
MWRTYRARLDAAGHHIQLSAGSTLFTTFILMYAADSLNTQEKWRVAVPAMLLAFVAGALGLVASTAHLGYPLNAFHALSHISSSWLSREIVFASLYLGILGLTRLIGLVAKRVVTSLLLLASLLGLIDLFCMSAIYAHTSVATWMHINTNVMFYRADRLVMPLTRVAPCTEELLMWHSEYGIRFVEMKAESAAGWFKAIATLNVRLKRMQEPLWNIVPPSRQTMNGSRRRWLHLKNEGASAGNVPVGRRFRRARFTQISEYHVDLDKHRCVLCGACSRVCPEQAIRLDNLALTLDPVKCTGCGNCEAVCFDGAISVSARENSESTLTVSRLEQAQCRVCGCIFPAWSAQDNECAVCRRHAFGMREA